ncbi:MAG TPA: DUF1330 domain-containing protein [Acetobacteraceae bacterium]|nr:DUF1330 domain-containing protein [Acetobacteraceae bacterium]
MPKGYILAEVEVTDPGLFNQYREKVMATVQAYGGRFVTRGGEPERLEGDRHPHRIVLLEFDSRERAREWYFSEQYQKILPLRLRSSNAHVVLLTGADPA